jgi:hypothetical protein
MQFRRVIAWANCLRLFNSKYTGPRSALIPSISWGKRIFRHLFENLWAECKCGHASFVTTIQSADRALYWHGQRIPTSTTAPTPSPKCIPLINRHFHAITLKYDGTELHRLLKCLANQRCDQTVLIKCERQFEVMEETIALGVQHHQHQPNCLPGCQSKEKHSKIRWSINYLLKTSLTSYNFIGPGIVSPAALCAQGSRDYIGIHYVNFLVVSPLSNLASRGYYFFIILKWGETAATTGLLYQPQMIRDSAAIGGIKIGRGNRSIRKKPSPEPLCPPQNPHDQIRWEASDQPPELWRG